MDNKVLTTLTYLQSLLDINDDEILISVKKDVVTMRRLSDLFSYEKVETIQTPNPIKNILDHINEQMCTDCLQLDYLFKDEFFLNLVRGYIEALIHEFGTAIPITHTLANAILNYELCPYKVVLGNGNNYYLEV